MATQLMENWQDDIPWGTPYTPRDAQGKDKLSILSTDGPGAACILTTAQINDTDPSFFGYFFFFF